MRIVQFHQINQVAEQFARGLRDRGHTADAVKVNLTASEASMPVKLAHMPERLLSLREYSKLLTPNLYDIAHIHWASYGILGFNSKIPYIIHCHGADVSHRMRSTVSRAVLTPILKNATAVWCITPDLLSAVQPVRPEALFFPGPVDTQRFAPHARAVSKPWTVLVLMRLEPVKKPEIALTGLTRFKQRHPEVRIEVIDTGTLRKKMHTIFGKWITFIPREAPEKVPFMIAGADVVVGQFGVGALGLSELQAMSCAKPVITGFRYPQFFETPPPVLSPQNSDEIVDALEYCWQYPKEVQSLGQDAREWVCATHDIAILAEKLEALYGRYVR